MLAHGAEGAHGRRTWLKLDDAGRTDGDRGVESADVVKGAAAAVTWQHRNFRYPALRG